MKLQDASVFGRNFLMQVDVDRTMIAALDVRLDISAFYPREQAGGNEDVVYPRAVV